MSKKAILISRNSDTRSTLVKQADLPTLYKRCGFRSGAGFKCQHTWKVKGEFVSVYGRKHGRATLENKTELPPPIDKDLFFGALIVTLADSNNDLLDLSIDRWRKIYEQLFGGFYDLEASRVADENEVDELADVPAEQLTRTGYLKDGWIVDDDTGSGLEEEDYE